MSPAATENVPPPAPAAAAPAPDFARLLGRFRGKWRRGLLAAALLVGGAAFLLAVGLGGVLDHWFGFAPGLRTAVVGALLAGVAFVFGRWLVRSLAFSAGDAAREADAALGAGGRVVAGLELAKVAASDESPFTRHLASRAVQQAAATLSAVPPRQAAPRSLIRRAGAWLLVAAAITGGLVALAPRAATVIGQRLLHPTQDLPPWSPFVFTVTPEAPAVVYGDDQLVQAEISGAPISGEVAFLIRDPRTDAVERAPCFRESSTTFARKLEKVTAPVDVAFAVGRARSAWTRVDVRYQPRITGAQVKLTPPAYSRQPARSFALGADEIKGLPGTQVEVTLQSNRPLAGGDLTVTPQGADTGEPVRGRPSGESAAVFKWTLKQSAKLAFTLTDMLGTRTPTPLELPQVVTPDMAPTAAIVAPGPLVMATPRFKLPFSVEVQDDLGLKKVELVRTLVGYRDRAKHLAEGELGLRFDADEPLDLAPLGVQPGDVLEFMVEATDGNPSLLGVGSSDVTRVMIISEDEYGARIRMTTTLEEFGARFSALAQAVEKARAALEKASEAAAGNDTKALAEALKATDQAHAEGGDLAKRLADDFQAYAMDGELAASARDVADAMQKNQADMESLARDPSPAAMQAPLKAMIDRLGGPREKVRQLVEQAEELKKVARLAELAAEFDRLVKNQESLVRRLATMAKMVDDGHQADTGGLSALAKTQEENREALAAFARDLRAAADALPEKFAAQASDARKFADALEALKIGEPMTAASSAARDARTHDAATNAALALALMKRLLEEQKKEDNQVAGMCEGNCSGAGAGMTPSAAQSLAQMLRSLLAKNAAQGDGQGQGQGQGMSPGGAGASPGSGMGSGPSSGFWMQGVNPLSIPAFGPDRLRLGPQSGQAQGGGGAGKGSGAGSGSGTRPQTATAGSAGNRLDDGGGVAPEQVPEAYREAVRRYFSRPTPTQP